MDKIRKYSLVDEAYKRIKEYLLNGDLTEGQKIPSENQLCKDLCVSRVVIREALSKLRSERMIVTYQGKGSFLANPINFTIERANLDKQMNFDLFVKVMEFREAIEFAAINYATQYATDEELKVLEVIVSEMEKASSDTDDFTIIDYQFHSHIVECSRNPFLVSAHESCKEIILTALKSMNLLGGAITTPLICIKKLQII